MRLKEIRTHKLFGLFDHVIPLNMDERITIIHGPNGFGKTAILRMIAGIFESSFSALRSLPFERLDLEFDDGRSLTVTKHVEPGEDGDQTQIVFDLTGNEPYTLSRGRMALGQFPLGVIDDIVSGLERVTENEWVFQPTGETLDLDDVYDRFADKFQLHLPAEFRKQEPPDWFVNLRNSLEVHFIRANRLERSEWEFRRRVMRRNSPTLVVARYATELAELIRTTLTEYADLSQSLDRSFPRRLVTSSADTVHSMDDIQDKLSELESRRAHLTDAGLLDKEEQTQFDFPAGTDNSKIDVLSVYIEDVEKKLSVFDSLYERIDLFKTILNRRFSFKTILIDKNDGIVFVTTDGAPLSPSSLSSGEQHEVVLLYQLLFKVKPNALMLIDEPELSLHIAWQQQFLEDLAQITRLSKFDVLIATHSPQIISDKWDLTVELTEPNGCENTLPTTTSLTR